MTLMIIVLIAMVFYVRNANAEKRADG
jgi:hypothetical protein